MKDLTNNDSTRDAVASELEWDPRLDAARVSVSASDGAVVLAGHVSSYSERWAAVKAAERVYGVRAVADEIEVQLPGSSERDDADIAEEIARMVHWNTSIPAAVKAEVIKGHVTLRGEVEWNYQRSEAERAVRNLAGVHNLSNVIMVKPRLPRAADVDRRVSEAIERMADLDSRSIWVTTRNGAVHLHGHVHSLAERRTAGFAAAAAPGVTTVENDILVTP